MINDTDVDDSETEVRGLKFIDWITHTRTTGLQLSDEFLSLRLKIEVLMWKVTSLKDI